MKDSTYNYILFTLLLILLWMYNAHTIKEIKVVNNKVEQLNTKIDLVVDSINNKN